MKKFELTRNTKTISTFNTLKEALTSLKNIAANDFSCDILEVREVVNGKTINCYDLNEEYWEVN